LWVIGYQGPMGYGVEFPLSRLGKAKILWVSGVYGLPGVWVRRVSTVPPVHDVVDARRVTARALPTVRSEWECLPSPLIAQLMETSLAPLRQPLPF
ncbi:hypothetical protein BD309DRAFT_877897, partial [Dichomitus squalens]